MPWGSCSNWSSVSVYTVLFTLQSFSLACVFPGFLTWSLCKQRLTAGQTLYRLFELKTSVGYIAPWCSLRSLAQHGHRSLLNPCGVCVCMWVWEREGETSSVSSHTVNPGVFLRLAVHYCLRNMNPMNGAVCEHVQNREKIFFDHDLWHGFILVNWNIGFESCNPHGSYSNGNGDNVHDLWQKVVLTFIRNFFICHSCIGAFMHSSR